VTKATKEIVYTEAETKLMKLQAMLVKRQSWKLGRKMALLRRIERAKKVVQLEKQGRK
jgi:hypothetical protein